MAIPLVGSPPPAPRSAFVVGKDLVTGNDSTFAASNGSWTNSGGTMTWDATTDWAAKGHGGSLKFVSTAPDQYVSLAIPGTFVTGRTYQCRIALVVEETSVLDWSLSPNLQVRFGSEASDVKTYAPTTNATTAYGRGAHNYVYYLLQWTPYADRTDVTVRLKRVTNETSPITWTAHIGDCRVMQVTDGQAGLLLQPSATTRDGVDGQPALVAPAASLLIGPSDGSGTSMPGLVISGDGTVALSGGDDWGSAFSVEPGYAWLYATSPDPDWHPLDEWNQSIDIEFGYDQVGFGLGEIDDHTAQFIPYQDVYLVDLGRYSPLDNDKRWFARTNDGQLVQLSRAIQSPFTAVDDLLVGASRSAQVGWSTSHLTATHPVGQPYWTNIEAVAYLYNWGYGTWVLDSVPIGDVTFHYDFWFSQSAPSGTRGFTIRLRRDTITGAVLTSQSYDGAEGNNLLGHQVHWVGTYVDAAPTTGVYVLTIERTGTAPYLDVRSDLQIAYVTATVAGPGERLGKGTDGQALAIDPSTHHVAWKDRLDYFQWPFYVPGVLTIGADKAAYFQVPNTCKIDEVRIHVGTAPTDASIIVDVNDDTTTIFTTQSNRPEIAISGTDDTSGVADGGTSVAKDSVLSIDIDQVGSSIAGSDLVIFVRGHYIW